MTDHRETVVNALRFYSQWMDALYRTSTNKAGAEKHAIEKHKAEEALRELGETA